MIVNTLRQLMPGESRCNMTIETFVAFMRRALGPSCNLMAHNVKAGVADLLATAATS